jgi:hypothetical protein
MFRVRVRVLFQLGLGFRPWLGIELGIWLGLGLWVG